MADPQHEKPRCFVIGAIGEAGTDVRKHADWLLKVILEVLAAEPFYYEVKRADHDSSPGSISSSIINDLLHSDLVVADFTFHNPNAMYELGIRHCAKRPAIHMCRFDTKLPFDNLPQRAVLYDLSSVDQFEKAKVDLAAAANAILVAGFQVDNPVIQAERSFTMRSSPDPRDRMVAALEERLATVEGRMAGKDQTISKHSIPRNQEQTLREAAYQLWENAGRPKNVDGLIWDQAAREVAILGHPPTSKPPTEE